MPTYDQTVTQLEQFFKFIQTAQTQLSELRRETYLDDDMYENERRRLQEDIRSSRRKLVTVLEILDRYPPRHHLRHFERLPLFHQTAAYEKSVFIMTKFPDPADPKGAQLQAVIDAVQEEVKQRGFTPRLAQGQPYYRWLFDNVEIYLLGCARGVAIVEDQYLPELNPNVALEWGWMTGMGRQVLFLREKAFQHARADWAGLLSAEFEWKDPRPGVSAAMATFLG
jgi:hypothetical protein